MIETITILGKSISLYYTFWLLGVIAVLIIGCCIGKHYGFSVSRSILYVTGAVALGYVMLWLTSWIFGGGKMIGLNYIRIVTFLPIPILLLSRVFKDSFENVVDFVSPLLAVFHGVTHLGCIFEGCCHGFSSTWGLYSNNARTVCFPIQPIEAISSILIGILLLTMIRRGKEKGKLYPWYLILFGSTRFIWEFFRDNEKIWHGISELAFHALGALFVGLIWFVFLKRFSKRKSK